MTTTWFIALVVAALGLSLAAYDLKRQNKHLRETIDKITFFGVNGTDEAWKSACLEMLRLSGEVAAGQKARQILEEFHAAFRASVKDVTTRLGSSSILTPMFEPAKKAAELLDIPLWKNTQPTSRGTSNKPMPTTADIADWKWPEHTDVKTRTEETVRERVERFLQAGSQILSGATLSKEDCDKLLGQLANLSGLVRVSTAPEGRT